MIRWIHHDINHYVNMLRENQYFSMAGFSDAEWFSVLKHDLGKATGLGQILDESTGDRLLDVLTRRAEDPRFIFAVPEVMWKLDDFMAADIGGRIEDLLTALRVEPVFQERDMITDELAEHAGLFPFIQQLQRMQTVQIGNCHLRGLTFLRNRKFITISSPNLHLEPGGIVRAVEEAIMFGQPAVYLVSAGMSAALIIDKLHDQIPRSWFIDCGSIWDAFVGIGCQREWRRKLYADPEKLIEWRNKNLGIT